MSEIKRNVVRTCWKVMSKKGFHKRESIVWAESAEAAKMQIPKDEKVVRVEPLDGRNGGPVA